MDKVTQKKVSTVEVKFAFKRNHQYFSLTLIVPMVMLTILMSLGLIMPGNCWFDSRHNQNYFRSVATGETIGFQVTLLLTVVVYIEYLQGSIPEFSDFDQAPSLLLYCTILKILLTFAIVVECKRYQRKKPLLNSTVTAYTMFLYNVNSYESENFSRSEALVSRGLANTSTKYHAVYGKLKELVEKLITFKLKLWINQC